MTGAATPIVAYAGSTPTRAVDTPMITMVIEERVLAADQVAEPAEHQRAERPHAKPAANASSAKMNAVVSLTPAKNCLPMIAASEPYR